MSIKVAIADDHPMVISGIKNMLAGYASEFICTDTYLDGASLLYGLEQRIPDVLLLDIQLPDKTGDQLLPEIRKRYPALKVLIVTNFSSAIYLNNMIRMGAHGYLLKNSREETLIEAIRTVYQGDTYIDKALRDQVDVHNTRLGNFNQVTLTLREKEILQLAVDGKSNQEIVETLFLSINTVKSYMARIFEKLDVKNRSELTRKALMLGLVK